MIGFLANWFHLLRICQHIISIALRAYLFLVSRANFVWVGVLNKFFLQPSTSVATNVAVHNRDTCRESGARLNVLTMGLAHCIGMALSCGVAPVLRLKGGLEVGFFAVVTELAEMGSRCIFLLLSMSPLSFFWCLDSSRLSTTKIC